MTTTQTGTAASARTPGSGIPWSVVLSLGVALGLLAGGILLAQAELRKELRHQLAHRDAQLLAALLQKQLSTPTAAGDADPLPALLETLILPELPGLRDVRLFDAAGTPTLTLLADPQAHLPSARQFRELLQELAEPNAEGRPATLPVAEEFHDDPGGAQLNVLLPILPPSTAVQGSLSHPQTFAAFTIDATGLSAEMVQMDRTLNRRNGLVMGLLGTAMAAALGWTFRRLLRTQRQLELHARHLETANRELALSAKTSAIGAVAAHLVHGLKNPLAGLQQFMANDEGVATGEDRTDAAATARRMKSLIDEVVRVLRDEQGLGTYELTLAELLSHVRPRCAAAAGERGIQFECATRLTEAISNRTANLAALILENLITNALQASSVGGTVTVTATRADTTATTATLRVRDCGPGLPESVRARLFQPGPTTKPDGTGLGLALSHQLARAAGGELALEETGAGGTQFALRIPLASDCPARSC